MRITRKVFYDLAIWMVGFGLFIGVVFPFFVLLLGVPSAIALKKAFFAACLGAGALAGILNYGLARWIVGERLQLLACSMRQVEQNLKTMTFNGELSKCTPETCHIPVDSEDEIGESALAFNRLVESLAISTKTHLAIRSFSKMLKSSMDVVSLAEQTLIHLFEHTDAKCGLILYESRGSMEIAASHKFTNHELLALHDHVNLALQTGEKQTISQNKSVTTQGIAKDFQPDEVVIFPVVNKKDTLGVVLLGMPHKLNTDQHALIDIFMEGLGLAMNNTMVHGDLKMLAALDPLTEIYNRRYGFGRLREEFLKAERSGSLLGVMLFDIDHFKVINDKHGHLVGDRVLKSICDIAKTSLRESDILFRYGGEEFVAVLPKASAGDLQNIAERLRYTIESYSLAVDTIMVQVTVSIGIAILANRNVENEDLLIQMADKALYEAKDSGRNQVVLAR